VNKLCRFTGTAVAAVTIAASAAAFSAPYAAARTTAQQATAAAAPATASPAPQPMIPAPLPGAPAGTSATTMIDTVFSHNWGGYAVHQSGVKFRAIKATFFVPFMNCTVTPGTTSPGNPGNYSSHWVGLDGFASHTVEQDGIEADCFSGSPHYDAWHEVFPRREQPVRMQISPGDSVTASVRYSSSTRKYRLEVMDNTNGNHFTVHQRCAGAACVRSSAEAISEAPSDDKGILPMADYGASSFSAISITGGSGQTGGIKSSHWSHSKIIQVGVSSGRTIASPTALHGKSFDVYWLGQN
jgi:hypothetical protein